MCVRERKLQRDTGRREGERVHMCVCERERERLSERERQKDKESEKICA